MSKLIPLYEPYFVKKDKKIISKCLDDNWVSTSGPLVEKFEQKIVKHTKCQYAVACSSGTAALHLALIGIGVKKNDLVLVSNLTFIALLMLLNILVPNLFFLIVIKKLGRLMNNLFKTFLKMNAILKQVVVFIKKQNKGLEQFYQYIF